MYVVAVVSWCRCSSSSFRSSSDSCSATFISKLVPPLSSVGGWGWLAEDTCNYSRDTCICYNGPPLHPAHQLWTALSLNGTKTVVRGEKLTPRGWWGGGTWSAALVWKSNWQPRKNIKPLASVHTHHPSTKCNWKKQPFLGIFFKSCNVCFPVSLSRIDYLSQCSLESLPVCLSPEEGQFQFNQSVRKYLWNVNLQIYNMKM